MYGYITAHSWGITLVLSDGRVYERREQPGGGPRWFLSERIVADPGASLSLAIDAWRADASSEWGADWREIGDSEIADEIGSLIYDSDSVTPAEVAETYGVKADTVRDAIEHGWIPARKSGSTWLIRRADAEARWGKRG